ncbi:MAG TPA: outer membrane protein transport protein [Thermoanaerobaculia bacterium]|nr:outer membrane protein transport protein [Thermoanaerobaculia bacterium]
MQRRGGLMGRALSVVALATLAAIPVHGAGFSIFEQGAKALGMGGAFTAQADDPSMLYYNAGGLAFVDKAAGSVGATWIRSTKADFHGANPFPGDGYSAKQETLSKFPPHAYFVAPISSTWKFGLGLETPFGLTTSWDNPNQFAGRFLSTKAALQAFDLNPTLGWQITPTFGIGVGGIVRVSKVELNRDIAAVDPFTLMADDVGRLKLTSDYTKDSYGFNIGILHKWNESFSWGLSYRSKISVDYTGSARLTPNATGDPIFDAILAAQLPYNTKLPVKTEIDYPDQASLGLAFGLTRNLLLETDINYTGWSSFGTVPINFTGGAGNSLPDASLPQKWKNAYSYRAGLRWTTSPSSQWRFGLVYDQTPQPEEGVSPLLPDADRLGYCIGYGHTTGFRYDVGLMYLNFHKRTVNQFRDSEGPFAGTYETQAVLLGLTLNL